MKEQDRKRILLVDDDKALLRTMTDYLTYEGFEVWQACDGKQALTCIDERTPDLIVLDISMPVMGGLEVLKKIQDSDGTTRYPVLVLTARGSMQQFFEGIAVDAFLAKPVSQDALIHCIRHILSASDQANERAERTQHKVLIGESDTRRAEVLQRAFREAGYEPVLADNGPDVLEKTVKEKPDAILMNGVLPRMNGSEVASLTRTMAGTSSIPVVLYDESQLAVDSSDRLWKVPEGVVVHNGGDAGELLRTVKAVIGR